MIEHLYRERLAGAHPVHRVRMEEFLRIAGAHGYRLLVVRVYASPAEQLGKWKVGRQFNAATGLWEIVGDIVTRAQPGTSGHEVVSTGGQPASMASDIVPVNASGEPQWKTPQEIWMLLWHYAAKAGLDALGDPWGRYLGFDKGHLECPAWDKVLEPMGARMPDISSLEV